MDRNSHKNVINLTEMCWFVMTASNMDFIISLFAFCVMFVLVINDKHFPMPSLIMKLDPLMTGDTEEHVIY